jgi:hypothetical protein
MTGAVVREVVLVGPVKDCRQPQLPSLGDTQRKEFVLAVVAAARRVVGKAGNLQLVALHNQLAYADGFGKPATLRELVERVGGRGCGQSDDPLGTERLTGDPEQIGRVDSAGEGDQRRAQAVEKSFERLLLLCWRHGGLLVDGHVRCNT